MLYRPRQQVGISHEDTVDSRDNDDELLGLCSGTFSSVSTGIITRWISDVYLPN